jgi:hypothetical protein
MDYSDQWADQLLPIFSLLQAVAVAVVVDLQVVVAVQVDIEPTLHLL